MANSRHWRAFTRLRYGNPRPADDYTTYRVQASVYDATRSRLLRGREDMLGLLAAQLKLKSEKQGAKAQKPIWVDVSISFIVTFSGLG